MLFIISGPSGSGKTMMVLQILSAVPNIEFSISWTTRQPRGSEQNGREYNFTTREEFERMIAANEFLEYAEVFGNYYGTSQRSLTEAEAGGRDLFLDIDVQGAAQVRSRVRDAVSIFVMPPNPEILSSRLNNRSRIEGNTDPVVIARRLAKARSEIENYREYDYILVNDILDRAVEELEAIVRCERLRRSGTLVTSDTLRFFEIAEGCRQPNTAERLRPVLEAFSIEAPVQAPEHEQYKLLEDPQ
jgi:guanylate kinase